MAMDYYFLFFYISEKYLQFMKKERHLLRKNFGSPHTSNRIYLLWNYFSNYINLKGMYKTLKGICIGVKNFGNLYISKFHGRIH